MPELNVVQEFWLNSIFLLMKSDFSLSETKAFIDIYKLNEDETEELMGLLLLASNAKIEFFGG